LNTEITDINNISFTWSFKNGMAYYPIGTSPPVVGGWTINAFSVNPTDIIILDTQAANASSQESTITISEGV